MSRLLAYGKAKIKGVVTTVGDKEVDFLETSKELGMEQKDALRMHKMMGFHKRCIVSDDYVTTSDLCLMSAKTLLKNMSISPESVDGLIFVSQTPDYQTPATSITLQHRLSLGVDTVCFDVSLGCSGFVYGLNSAFGLIQAGLKRVLLCVGDVASRIVDPKDQSISPIMGDAGSCILIDAEVSDSWFQLYSDGSGRDALIMPNSGARRHPDSLADKSTLQMNGADVFSFSIKRVPPMIEKICSDVGIAKAELDYFVLHQPNQYMVDQIAKRLGISEDRLPSRTQSKFGNQNSASIPGTLNGLLSAELENGSFKVCLAGFGVGLSWGAAILELDHIYCPKSQIWSTL